MIIAYDLEQFINFHSFLGIDVNTKEEYCFVIHEARDDRILYGDFLERLRYNKNSGMVAFNGLEYDYPMLHTIYKLIDTGQWLQATVSTILSILRKKTEQLINKDRDFGKKAAWNTIHERFHHVAQLDPFKQLHWNNSAKSTSLKKCQNNLRWHTVQSLPLNPDEPVSKSQIPEIVKYNRNDVLPLVELYWILKGDKSKISVDFPGLNDYYIGKDRIEFRKRIGKQYGFNCINWNDVKIGEEINKQVYLMKSGRDWKDVRNLRTHRTMINLREMIPPYIKSFHNKKLNQLLTKVRDTTIYFGETSFKEEVLFADNIWVMGLGGIHTKDKPRLIERLKGDKYNERDVGSMYTTKMKNAVVYPEHLGIAWLDGVLFNMEKRLSLKPLAKKDKIIKMEVDALKLSLNGGSYGKMGDEYNWQYDPYGIYKTTIGCQLDILLLADELYRTNKIKIESANTDGLNIIYSEKDEDLVNNICSTWEKVTNAELETTEYIKVARTTVNDYMAMTPDGYIKRKGDFEVNKELHKDMSMHIVRVAIDNYFTQGISASDTIKNCTNIYDFCKYKQVKGTPGGKWQAQYNYIGDNGRKITEDVQKDVRYYISNNGKSTISKYCYSGKSQGKIQQLEAGKSSILFNNFIQRDKFSDYKVDYKYYINEANKIINNVLNYGQLTLF